MQLITRIPTRQYFITIFVIASLLFLSFSFVIYHNFTQARELNQWTMYNYEVMRQSRKILIDLVDMETGVRGYIITNDKSFLAPYDQSRKTVLKQIEVLREMTGNDPTTQGNINEWLEGIETFTETLATQVQLVEHGKIRLIREMTRQKKQMDALRQNLQDYIQVRLEDLNKRIKSSNEANDDFKYILAIGTILAIAGMFVATLVILALLSTGQRAEAESRAIEERFRMVMNGVNDGLFDFDLSADTVYFSPQYKSMLGYTDDEVENSWDWVNSTMHPDDRAEMWMRFDEYRANPNTPQYRNTFRLRTKAGDWVWIMARGIGLFDAQGRMTRLIGTHTDISDQKRREEELATVNKEMETFTYITSHDLRAPLVNLKGFSGELTHAISRVEPIIKARQEAFDDKEFETLKRSLDEDIPESIRFITQSVEKMDSLTTAVLDLSRIGKREYHFNMVDVTSVVRRCLDSLAYEIGQKKITVHCEALLDITSDALALEQVFSNILDNAVKYLDASRPPVIAIASHRAGSTVTYSIADNGRGIAEADYDKVFQIFRRARNSVNVRGLGLGMAFVQATVRRLGGTIWFTSMPDEGTTFYFNLPISPRIKG